MDLIQENQELRAAIVTMIEEMDQLRRENQELKEELKRTLKDNYELTRDKDVLYFELQNWKPSDPESYQEPKRKCVMSIE